MRPGLGSLEAMGHQVKVIPVLLNSEKGESNHGLEGVLYGALFLGISPSEDFSGKVRPGLVHCQAFWGWISAAV